jgi:hypothetical protein
MSRPPRISCDPRRVVAYWHARGEPFPVDLDWPACFACGREVTAWRQLERAHLIDRICDGLDGPQNLVMLCSLCHRMMPVHRPGQEDAAFNYVLMGGYYPVLSRLLADDGGRL